MNFTELLSNSFVKLVIALFFFLFIYKILYATGVFFGIDPNVLNMYFIWLAVIIFLGIFLPPDKSKIFKTPKTRLSQLLQSSEPPQGMNPIKPVVTVQGVLVKPNTVSV